jgi:cyclophilin family peptidyl-prolyl cis-trans isomerase
VGARTWAVAVTAAMVAITTAACGNGVDVASSNPTTTARAAAASGPSGASGSGASSASGADATPTTRAGATTSSRPVNATGPDGYGTTDCPPPGGAAGPARTFPAPFKRCIDATKTYTATITTNKGVLTVELLPKTAPLTVNNFVALARNKFYDGLGCHRIIPNFVAQCGDPTGKGSGGPGYKFNDELPRQGVYKVGSLAMANSGPNTNGSQFFVITGTDGVALPPNYSLFGQAVNSDATLKALDAAGNPSNNGMPPKQTVSITSVVITER